MLVFQNIWRLLLSTSQRKMNNTIGRRYIIHPGANFYEVLGKDISTVQYIREAYKMHELMELKKEI